MAELGCELTNQNRDYDRAEQEEEYLSNGGACLYFSNLEALSQASAHNELESNYDHQIAGEGDDEGGVATHRREEVEVRDGRQDLEEDEYLEEDRKR